MKTAASAKIPDVRGPSGQADELEQIIYHLTHDVRATLRAIKTLPSWVREAIEADGSAIHHTVDEPLTMLETQAARADRMLADLLVYSRVGRKSDGKSIVSLNHTIEAAARKLGLPTSFQLKVDLAAKTIAGAQKELELLFQILISNAVTHHDKDSGVIEITAEHQDGGISIGVEDDGPGIPVECRECVFELMSMLKSRDECEGSGVGLSIARKIATLHGGDIRITDPRGARGARIEVRLSAQSVNQ